MPDGVSELSESQYEILYEESGLSTGGDGGGTETIMTTCDDETIITTSETSGTSMYTMESRASDGGSIHGGSIHGGSIHGGSIHGESGQGSDRTFTIGGDDDCVEGEAYTFDLSESDLSYLDKDLGEEYIIDGKATYNLHDDDCEQQVYIHLQFFFIENISKI